VVKTHLDPQRLFVETTCKKEQQKKTPTTITPILCRHSTLKILVYNSSVVITTKHHLT